ncbi:energy transducer TonB [Microbulbifer hydrolyticus]|uniref:TonB family protein n=1 Tax=Microbulbifer hydrolyticus TaxID=48074 RepID=A0A6P1T6N9_9GAMM|nr:TonB family protein [Microbulbifer hydrolyticus]MBB5211573.1 TonB family protein [Microbulbifer hydrolyticus]QHQ37687.1 TonB family protein [Microbulbifer hydrolyticus]
MVKLLVAAASLIAASQAFSLDWQRPDCSAFESFSECRNAESNAYRRQKQQELRDKGLSFWYFERPDFSDNEKVEEALENKVEGVLFVSFTVASDGSVSEVAVKEKSSEDVAVYAAPILAAMKNWQFVPSETSWPNQEWRYQFFFEPEECEADSQDGDCEADPDA